VWVVEHLVFELALHSPKLRQGPAQRVILQDRSKLPYECLEQAQVLGREPRHLTERIGHEQDTQGSTLPGHRQHHRVREVAGSPVPLEVLFASTPRPDTIAVRSRSSSASAMGHPLRSAIL